MRELVLGKLRARVAGGEDRQGSGKGPVVVLLHGYGAPGTDLVPLWRVIDAPQGTRFVFPEAPIALGPAYGEGRAWWHIDISRFERALSRGAQSDLTAEIPEGLAESREAVIEFLEGLAGALDAPRDGLILGGFSQGAMLSLDVALRSEIPLAALALMSGTLIAEKEWRPLMPRRSGLRVLQSHGDSDPLLPFAIAEQLRDALKAAGLQVSFIPFRGGHAIPPEALTALGALVRESTSVARPGHDAAG